MMMLFDFETKTIVYEEDATKADELINAGKAVKLDLPELERFEKAAADIYDEYMAKVKQIKTSDNPIYTEEVKKYELARLKEEYEQKSQEIEAEYQEYRKKAIEDAKVRAARAVVKVSEKDKLTAEQFATRASLELAGAFEHEKGGVIAKIIEDIRLLTDEQRTALQAHAGELLANIDDATDKRKLIDAIKEVRNPDLLAVEVAKQLPHTVLIKQRQRAIIEQVVNEPSAITGGDIDREFYEKHLKGANK